MKKLCSYCDRYFDTNRKHQIYCSGYCSHQSRRINLIKLRPCYICGSKDGIRFIKKTSPICKECFRKMKGDEE